MNEKEVELAKSWFMLSQILIILAGFLFTAGGVAHSNYISIFNSEFNILNGIVMQSYNNPNSINLENISDNTTIYRLIDLVDKEAKSQENLSKDYIRYGIGVSVLSILFWANGYSKMQRV